jgi:regulator of PEP synthase PpsR (kinase-PPPase family)
MTKVLKLIIISDGTGETASSMARAVMMQFADNEIFFTRYKNVRTKEQIDGIFTEAALHHDMIIYTIVSKEMREYMAKLSIEKHVRSLDLLGPILTYFSNYFEQEPTAEPGLYHAVNDNYFKRVAAMEFTLNHDDGKNLESLHLADVILVGISRTSKTPLSMYLSFHGLKVVNVPIIKGVSLPDEVKKIDQRKIFGLTIDADTLKEIRQNRLSRLGVGQHQGAYAGENSVNEELEWSNKMFAQNKRWPVLNVTGKAVEETASEIMKLLNMRKENLFKQKKRFE